MTPADLAAHLDDMTGHDPGVVAVELAPVAIARALREARRVLPWLPDAHGDDADPLALAFAQAVLGPAEALRNGAEVPIHMRSRARISADDAVSALRASYAAWAGAAFALEANAAARSVTGEAA